MENIKDKIKSNDDRVVYEVLEYIANNKLTQYFEDIIELLNNNKSIFIKEKIFNTLETLINNETIYMLLPLLVHPEPYVRNGVLNLLKINEPIIFEYLKTLIDDQDKNIRKYVLDILFNYKHPESAPIIEKALNDKDINNVIAACEYLGKLGYTKAKPKIEKIIEESDNIMLLHSAIEALSEIGDNKSISKVYEKVKKLDKDVLKFSFFKLIKNKGENIDDLNILISYLDINNQFSIRYILDAIVFLVRKFNNENIKLNNEKLFNFIITNFDNIRNSADKLNLLEIAMYLKPESKDTLKLFKKSLNNNDELLKSGAVEFLLKLEKIDDEIIRLLNSIKNLSNDEDLIYLVNQVLTKFN